MNIKKPGFAIAIDGPVGVGKSTTAKNLASILGIAYIDTGAMYRAVAYYNLTNNFDITDQDSLAANMKNIHIALSHTGGTQRIHLNGEDITEKIRTQEISQATSIISVNPVVRQAMVKMQQDIAKKNPVVMDGRDISSKVLPWAPVKIYLDAPVEVRAQRRLIDLDAKGQSPNFDHVLEETKIRDHRDQTREVSPLIKTEDAIRIDTNDMTPMEVAKKILSYVKIMAD